MNTLTKYLTYLCVTALVLIIGAAFSFRPTPSLLEKHVATSTAQ